MSIRTLSRVWADSRHAGTNLLMLLAIADFADDDGRAYPSVAGLADKCRMKPRNANYILSELQASGELRVLLNKGPRGKNLYQIVFSAMKVKGAEPLQSSAGGTAETGLQRSAGVEVHRSAGVQRSAGLQSSVATPALECAKPLQHSAPEPSLNRQEPSGKRRARQKSPAPPSALSCPKDVDPQTWTDWVALRKAKKTTISPTVLRFAEREAAKAGWTLEAFLAEWCARGSQGFKAEWITPQDRQRFGSSAASDRVSSQLRTAALMVNPPESPGSRKPAEPVQEVIDVQSRRID